MSKLRKVPKWIAKSLRWAVKVALENAELKVDPATKSLSISFKKDV